ncbi:acylphosphatase [Candidatus Gottesmanbacteria bacterium]|nr:acylphosphatase [Candidatus Gottesmanbacteria bacterium]
MQNVRAHLLIYGDVIGVGFRYWTVRQARKLGLRGWVKNLSDSVEAIIEGPKEKVEEMIRLLHEGSPTSMVKNIDVQWEECRGEFDSFEIKN